MLSSNEEIRGLRLRLSTLTGYLVLVYRMFTSLLFTVIVLRRLSIMDYGLFMVIMALTQLFIPLNNIWNIWVYRFYTRKKYGLLSSGFLLNIIHALLSAVVIGIVLHNMRIEPMIILVSQLLVITNNLSTLITLLVEGVKPYISSYIRIMCETTRVVLAYILIICFNLGVLGVIVAVLTFYVLTILLSTIYLYRNKYPLPSLYSIKWDNIKTIFKNFYIPLLTVINHQIKASAERLITTFTTHSYIYPAFLGVSYIPKSYLVGGIFTVTRALSTRLLKNYERRDESAQIDIEDSLRIIFLINIFIAGLLIVYSRVILSIFKPEYIQLYILLILYTIVFTIDIIRITFSTIGTALEEKDLHVSGLALRNSLLFKNSLLMVLSSITYIVIATIIFLSLNMIGISNPVILLLPFPSTALITYLISTYIFYKRSLLKIRYRIPWRELLSAITGVLVFGIIGYMSGLSHYAIGNIYRDSIILVEILVISIISYFLTIYMLSPWVRRFIKIIFIKSRKFLSS